MEQAVAIARKVLGDRTMVILILFALAITAAVWRVWAFWQDSFFGGFLVGFTIWLWYKLWKYGKDDGLYIVDED